MLKSCCWSILVATSLLASQQPQPLDLNGVWNVNGVAVGIKQSASNVTATFLGSPGCSISEFFSAQLSGATAGSAMTGPIKVCRDPAQLRMCPNPLPPSFSANMRATVQPSVINIEYEDEGIVVTKNRLTGNITSCTTRPATSTAKLVLTRCSSSSSDCGCQRANIDILKRLRQGQELVKQKLEQALATGIGPTFRDVNRWIDQQLKSQSNLNFEQMGFPDIQYVGCTDAQPTSQCSSIKIVPNCKPSPSGIKSLDTMCEQHELAHGADLQLAFKQLKSGQWTDDHFQDYVEGKSSQPGDLSREIEDEIARTAGDIDFLNNEISRLEQQQKQKCP